MDRTRVYESAEPGKVSGRIIVGPSRRVLFLPALRFIPGREIDRKNAANVIREARGKMRLRVRAAEAHELSFFWNRAAQ